MPTGKRAPQRLACAGFTYLGLIILVAIIGLVGAAGLKMGALMQRRAAELALLDIGVQFAEALKSYAAATPRGQPPQPPSIKELLRDPRFPGVRRHLRRQFVDPITGNAEWGVSYLSGETGVTGFHSLSTARPIKIGNFAPWLRELEGKSAYREWEFGLAQAPEAAGPAAGDPNQISPMELYEAPQAASVKAGPAASTNLSGESLIGPLTLQ